MHHSSEMGQCVLKMNHFCEFTMTPIGLYNRKRFLLFLFVMLISCVVWETMAFRFFFAMNGFTKVSMVTNLIIGLMYLFIIAGIVYNVVMLYWHLKLFLKNQTVIEDAQMGFVYARAEHYKLI